MSITAWQLSIAILFGVNILTEHTIELLFRFFRIGSVSFVFVLFYLVYTMLYFEGMKLSARQMKFFRNIFNKKSVGLFLAWTVFVYVVGWTNLGISGLTLHYNDTLNESFYYPLSGEWGWTFKVHILSMLVINLMALYLVKKIKDQNMKRFLATFLWALLPAYLFGVVNLSPNSSLVQSIFTLFILVIAIVLGYVNMHQNIIKDSSERLHLQRAFLKKVIDINPNLIYIRDSRGNFAMVNEAFAQFYGIDQEEAIGKNERAFLNRSAAGEWMAEDLSLIQQLKEKPSYETTIVNKYGEESAVQVIKKLIYSSKNQVELLCVVNDVTAIKENEEYLRRTEKLNIVGQLAAGVAHEIRNPLTSLKGFIQLINQERPIQPAYLNVMLSELDRIDYVAGELMMVAKPETSKVATVSLNELLVDVTELLTTYAVMHGISIQLEEIEEKLFIEASLNQMKQVFINVIKNGIEASPKGASIIIRAKSLNNDAVVEVIDVGCGISPERIEKLGEPFFTNKEKGTGLGLMVSTRIIKEHHGTIKYFSQVGEGTTVILQFPLKQTQRVMD
ncbi:PAS domain S-box-containing protein [Bacillus ectoiniformans]|nr:PAS domain S-box-containing protein [Bacillus ectoiniformans]